MNNCPLNVYVRIRPFISNEIDRGENQKLLDIIDEKHITVKLNTIRTLQTSYNEYEVTKIFDQICSQNEFYEQILDQPTNELFTGTNWLLCTLGLTNSGKTHTMFGTNDDPGLIPRCLNRIFRNIGENIDEKVLFKPIGLENFMPTVDCDLSKEINVRNYIFKDEKSRMRLPNIVEEESMLQDLSIEDEQYSVWVSFFELYNENILDLLVQQKDIKLRKNLRLMQNERSTMIKNLIQIPVFDIKEAEHVIKFGLVNRSTSKTNLNESSSRSHAVLCITLIKISEFDEEPTMNHMYICDLAGNEPSTATGKQLTETCNINTSLMTFKDCIRTLNENQTAKKQMLIPYRNSVLTSIFRPFFIGRGRTILCCNVNPCATFISQTNDLLKFCALAQKVIVVPVETKPIGCLIRRKSKTKGPKRLGRTSFSKDKPMTDDELVEFDYWKYNLQYAFDLLQKQANQRRRILIEQHNERIQTVQYLLNQRQKIEILTEENQSLLKQNEHLLENLRHEQDNHLHTKQMYNDSVLNEKQYRQKLVKLEKESHEDNRYAKEEIESLKKQIKTLQQQFERVTNEHLKTIEQIERDKHEQNEREQRLKRDFGLELYRKQDAEKKARVLEDKLRYEQTEYQKMQYDYTKTQHDFKTLQVKYDILQIELNEFKQNRISMKRRTNDEDHDEREIKKPKRTGDVACSHFEEQKIDSKPKTNLRGRPKKQTIQTSPIYATIQRNVSSDRTSFDTVVVVEQTNVTTPKPSTFKRIQSLFRTTPTSTGSTRANHLSQVKGSVVAFGSSTPTNRLPQSTIKKVVQNTVTPKSRYNLRTRIFNNPTHKKDNENGQITVQNRK